ncbi:MAG: hypothetical protein H7Y86_04605 [Rhizobacter sp.]|nr:hypothetical protein [Ferruginibacter sp.]
MLYNEKELLRMLLLLSDTQCWLNELATQCVYNLHPPAIKLVQAKTYRLGITALAHIVERHYHKTLRHPGTGKFNIPLAAIIDYIKEAGTLEAIPVKGNINFRRCMQLPEAVGTGKSGEPAYRIVVITDPGGNIITAYPE